MQQKSTVKRFNHILAAKLLATTITITEHLPGVARKLIGRRALIPRKLGRFGLSLLRLLFHRHASLTPSPSPTIKPPCSSMNVSIANCMAMSTKMNR